MTHERAAFLYRRDYWDAMRLDRLPARVAMAVFDAAVNCGVSAVGKQLQQAVNSLGAEPPLVVDGIPGPMTAAAVRRLDSMGTLPFLISELLLARVAHYSGLCERKASQRGFLRGWIRRVVAMRQAPGRTCSVTPWSIPLPRGWTESTIWTDLPADATGRLRRCYRGARLLASTGRASGLPLAAGPGSGSVGTSAEARLGHPPIPAVSPVGRTAS